jgi:hypothetical protein
MYFQLYPSTLPTEGIGFGLLPTVVPESRGTRSEEGMSKRHSMELQDMAIRGLLPTPTVMDTNCGDLEKIDQRRARALAKGTNGNGFGMTIGELANRNLLPTPTAKDEKNGEERPNSILDYMNFHGMLPTPKVGGKEGYETRAKRQGHQKAISHLEAFVEYQMLPTPTARCWNTGTEKERPLDEPSRRSELNHLIAQENGKPSRLNPQFVLEMMGFPPDWTELPFLSGETNPSKPEETQ